MDIVEEFSLRGEARWEMRGQGRFRCDEVMSSRHGFVKKGAELGNGIPSGWEFGREKGESTHFSILSSPCWKASSKGISITSSVSHRRLTSNFFLVQ